MSNSLARNSYALIALARLKNKDDYTYLHSFAVCALMVALARTLGLPEDEIRECGLGGLVHDIGKSAMPRTLLDKSTALTKEELALLQTHAVGGHHLMMGTGQFGEIPREVCLHHHERIDGSGYPDAQKGDEISLWAKMGAICDVYDTLTSSSPYHHAWSPAQALKYMMARTDTQFDRTVFQAFTRSVGIYPVGTLVKLRTNRLGVVVHQNESSVMRPDVVVFYSGNTKTRVCVPSASAWAVRTTPSSRWRKPPPGGCRTRKSPTCAWSEPASAGARSFSMDGSLRSGRSGRVSRGIRSSLDGGGGLTLHGCVPVRSRRGGSAVARYLGQGGVLRRGSSISIPQPCKPHGACVGFLTQGETNSTSYPPKVGYCSPWLQCRSPVAAERRERLEALSQRTIRSSGG